MPRSAEALSDTQTTAALERLRHWHMEQGHLVCLFLLPSFTAAIRFVNQVASLAEEHGHHPAIEVNFDRVRLSLQTHDVGAVTQRDIKLARAVNVLCRRPGGR